MNNFFTYRNATWIVNKYKTFSFRIALGEGDRTQEKHVAFFLFINKHSWYTKAYCI